ncbi:MAG: SPOR domain-containing protein [Gemmatimonadetes bacterium]|nr:SPOR domain-containing protein [Gemmatimonadota bacterium]
MRDYEAMWEAAGGRVSAAVGAATAVAVLGDDPAATGAVALGIGRIHARDRRVFLFDLLGGTQGLVPYVDEDDSPGVSDMVHYGISLGRTARPQSGTPNLFIVPGGAESPLSEAVLTDRWWDVIIEQVRRSNALLLIAAPSMVPGMREMVSHLNGVLLVGEAVAPTPFIPVLAEVRAAATVRTQITPPGTARSVERSPQRRRWPLAVAVSAIALATVAALTAPRWRPLLSGGGEGEPASDVSVALPPIPPPPASRSLGDSTAAAFSVELLFTNSSEDALQYLAQALDSVPAATFSILSRGPEGDLWYRLLAGGFPDSTSADAYLARLRFGGRLTAGAGAVTRTPFALLLDSASSDALARVRVSAYRGRGIPAYVLRDSVPVWRVYAGAFSTEDDGLLLKQHLDSLNIQSALVMRAGSTP